jgi:hypothetical protein
MRTHTTDKLIEYINLHLISLKQDLEKIEDHEVTNEGYPKEYIQGAIAVLNHILEVANDYV